MEGPAEEPVVIEVAVDGRNTLVSFKVEQMIPNYALHCMKFNVVHNSPHTRTIHINHAVSVKLRLGLVSGGIGYRIKLLPDNIEALLIPAASEDIWNISAIDGAIPRDGVIPKGCTSIINERGYLNNILTLSGLKSIPNFILNKPYEEIVGQTTTKRKDCPEPMKVQRQLESAREAEIAGINELVMNPESLLAERYYSMLLTEKSMVSHFSKSSLPKLQLMCKNDMKKVFEVINSVLIFDVEEIHTKYSSLVENDTKLPDFTEIWLAKQSKFCPEDENKYKRQFCDYLQKRIPPNIKLIVSDVFKRKWDGLKIKETQLQIILALEQLKIVKADPSLGTDTPMPVAKKPVKRKRNVLVGKKKRLMPTLLGTVIPTAANFDFDFRHQETLPLEERLVNVRAVRTKESLIELVKSLFDILSVQDALVGKNHKDPSSAYSFIVTNLVPYYEKDHLSVLKELVGKVRGASYLAKRKSKRDKERKRKEKEERNLKRSVSQRSDISLLKNELNLSRHSSQAADLKLKRTHSSFTSNMDWDRKGFDMVKCSNNLASSLTQLDGDLQSSTTFSDEVLISQPKSQTLGGFMNSRKRQRELKAAYVAPTVVAEPETPRKIKKRMDLMNNMFANDPNIKAGDIIEATPAKNRIRPIPDGNSLIPISKRFHGENVQLADIIESPFQIKRSPVKDKQRKLGVGTVSATPTKSTGIMEVNSTPMKSNSPVKQKVQETPQETRVEVKPGIFEINSSPFKSPYANTPRNPHRVIVESPILQLKHASTRIKSANTSSKGPNRRLNFG